jgi:hypothetical protein
MNDHNLLNRKTTDMIPAYLPNCPNNQCNAALSNYEQKERECFTCGWKEDDPANITGTIANVPVNYEYDREIDDDTHD